MSGYMKRVGEKMLSGLKLAFSPIYRQNSIERYIESGEKSRALNLLFSRSKGYNTLKVALKKQEAATERCIFEMEELVRKGEAKKTGPGSYQAMNLGNYGYPIENGEIRISNRVLNPGSCGYLMKKGKISYRVLNPGSCGYLIKNDKIEILGVPSANLGMSWDE